MLNLESVYTLTWDFTTSPHHMTVFLKENTQIYAWRKICVEFGKRLYPDLGFYYFTSSHDRFLEGEYPDFDHKSTKRARSVRVRRREQPSHLMGGRAISQPGSQSTRMTFHITHTWYQLTCYIVIIHTVSIHFRTVMLPFQYSTVGRGLE